MIAAVELAGICYSAASMGLAFIFAWFNYHH